MSSIRDFYVARAVEITVESERVKRYNEIGIVLVDYSGNDLINVGEKYLVVNGNLKPEELQYFNVISVGETKSYLYMARRLDSFLLNARIDEENKVYRDMLLRSEELSQEEVVRLFSLIVPNHYRKENVNILKNV